MKISWFTLTAYLLLLCIEVQCSGIGPDEDEYCSTGNCLYDDDDGNDTELNDESGDGGGDTSTTDDIAKRPSSYMDKIRSPFRFIWNTGKVVADKVYNATVETIEDIAEILRIVLNEEAFNMVTSAAGTLVDNVISTDTIFGYTLNAVHQSVLSVSIFLFMVLFNYIFFGYFGLLITLVIDSTVFLLHHSFGPVFIANCIIDSSIYTYGFLATVVAYPYAFAFGIVFLFIFGLILSCVWPYIRRRFYYLRTDSDVLYFVNEKIDRLTDTIDKLDERTSEMQKMLKVVHEYVEAEKAARREA